MGLIMLKQFDNDVSLQKLTVDYEVLLEEHSDMKKKLEASKSRNKVLSTEVKALKSQISTLLDKGKHDDELVDVLLVTDSWITVWYPNTE